MGSFCLSGLLRTFRLSLVRFLPNHDLGSQSKRLRVLVLLFLLDHGQGKVSIPRFKDCFPDFLHSHSVFLCNLFCLLSLNSAFIGPFVTQAISNRTGEFVVFNFGSWILLISDKIAFSSTFLFSFPSIR